MENDSARLKAGGVWYLWERSLGARYVGLFQLARSSHGTRWWLCIAGQRAAASRKARKKKSCIATLKWRIRFISWGQSSQKSRHKNWMRLSTQILSRFFTLLLFSLIENSSSHYKPNKYATTGESFSGVFSGLPTGWKQA